MHNGKRVRISLKTENKVEAETKAAEIVAITSSKDDIEVLQSVKRAIQSKSDAIKDSAIPRCKRQTVSDIWKLFLGLTFAPSSRIGTHSKNYIRDCRQIFNRFSAWCEAHSLKYTEQLTRQDAEAFIATVGKAPASKNNYIAMLKSIFNVAGVDPNPFNLKKRPNRSPETREIFSSDDLKKIFISATDPEVYLFFKMLLYTGRRPCDCVTMTHDMIQDDFITLTETKTGKTMTFPIHKDLKEALNQAPPSNNFLFPKLIVRHRNGKLSKVVGEILSAAGVGDGNGRKWGAYSFRHTFAARCAAAGIPLVAIQDWLGHSSPAITKIYATHFTNIERKKMLQKLKF